MEDKLTFGLFRTLQKQKQGLHKAPSFYYFEQCNTPLIDAVFLDNLQEMIPLKESKAIALPLQYSKVIRKKFQLMKPYSWD